MEQPPKKRAKRGGAAEAAGAAAAMAAGAAGGAAAPQPPVSCVSYRWKEANVFNAIDGGRFPADKIFDGEHWFALLDKAPVTRGHALLITKHPVATLFEDAMPEQAAAAAVADLRALSRAVQQATGCLGVRVRQNNGPAAGQVVPQLHFHVIPCDAPEDEDASRRAPLQDDDAGPLLAAVRNALPPAYSGPGVHAWVPSATAMEQLGHLLHGLCVPGTVLLLSGHLGSGKTAIARGLVRAFTRDPQMFVPSPTFLLNLTYEEDTAHEPAEPQAPQRGEPGIAGQPPPPPQQQQQQQEGQQQQQQQQQEEGQQRRRRPGSCVHHMDPYRLGNADKMAGLIDFQRAFLQDICVVEWPSRMPRGVMQLPRRRTIEVQIAGSGAQAAGRLVHISCTHEEQQQQQQQEEEEEGGTQQPPPPQQLQQEQQQQPPPPPPQQQQQQQQQENGLQQERGQPQRQQKKQRQRQGNGAAGSTGGSGGGGGAAGAGGPCAQLLLQWRADNRLPEVWVDWREPASEEEDEEEGEDGAGGGSADAAVSPPPEEAAARGAARRLARAQRRLQAQAGGAAGVAPAGPPESWLVLGIESSCDDTAAAVVRGDGTVLSHLVASQVGLHEQYGGVKPDVAQAAHAAAIESTVAGAIAAAGVEPGRLSAVAVTVGPGLSLCLQVGVRHALTIAAQHKVPWVPVHHMEAHALVAAMPGVLDGGAGAGAQQAQPGQPCGGQQQEQQQQQPRPAAVTFPALLLLVSGGHNMLVRCEGVGRHTILGTTTDDSMGEAFDKVARLLGIPAIPGGPQLERLAASALPGDTSRYRPKLQPPMRSDRESCNFSFSGLKTAVGKLVADERARLQEEGAGEEQTQRVYAAIAQVFQDVCVRFLQERTERALQRCQQDAAEAGQPMVTCLVVAGGVAANAAVRSALAGLAEHYGLPCAVPPAKYCGDNGLMVAWTGVERLRLGLCRAPPPSLDCVDAAVEVLPRWPLGPVDVRGMSKATVKHCKLLH